MTDHPAKAWQIIWLAQSVRDRPTGPPAGAGGGEDPLAGRCEMTVLVVEDDYFQAERLVRGIEEAGCAVLGPFATAREAMARVAMADAAILDVRLGDDTSFVLADYLASRGVPFVFYTGYGRAILPDRFGEVPLYNKPHPVAALVVELQARRAAPVVGVLGLFPLLRAHSRTLMPDHDSADRLLEAALRAAVELAESGAEGVEQPDLHAWLIGLIDREHRRGIGKLLN